MTQWDRGHGTPAIPDPFGVAVEHDEEFEPALALHHNIRMVAVGIPEEVLDRIDLDAMGVTSNPECPDELRCLPLWAVRSNIIGEAVSQMYEMQDLLRSWTEE